MADEKIKNSRELEFAVFCIENTAAKLGVNAERVCQAFTEKSNILNGYIVPEYEILHTQGREYIADDFVDMIFAHFGITFLQTLQCMPLGQTLQSPV